MISHGNIWAVLLALVTVKVAEDGYFKVILDLLPKKKLFAHCVFIDMKTPPVTEILTSLVFLPLYHQYYLQILIPDLCLHLLSQLKPSVYLEFLHNLDRHRY